MSVSPTVIASSRRAGNGARLEPDAHIPHPARPSTRRNPRLIIAGVLLVCLGALGSAWLWTAGRDEVAIVVTARDIPAGQVIVREDLTTVKIAATAQVMRIPATDIGTLLGARAARDLPSGVIIDPSALTAQTVTPGRAHIGLALPDGRLPNRPLPSGARIRVIGVDAGANGEVTVDTPGMVVAPPTRSAQGSWLVDVEVDASQASKVAALAAADQVVLVWEGV